MVDIRQPDDEVKTYDVVEVDLPLGAEDPIRTVVVTDAAGTVEVMAFRRSDGSVAARIRARGPGRAVVMVADTPVAEVVVDGSTASPAPLSRNARMFAAGPRMTTDGGDPFLWIGDTWWLGLSGRLADDEFTRLASFRAGQGYSVVQLVAGLYPDVDWRDDLVTVSGFAPFDDELHPDPHWFDRADRRVRALVRAGIVPCVFGLWAYHVGFVGIDAAMRLWREIIARWSALPVIWTVAGEASLPWYGRLGSSDIDAVVQAQLEDIRRLASFVRQHDTYLNPIAAHPCPGTGFVSSLDQFEEHLDLIMLQTGHRGQWSIPVAHEALATARERRPEVPVVNAEASYEGILGSSWHSDQRWQAWSQLLGGAAGFTYGAQGLWRFDQGPNDPLRAHTGSWGEYRWQDAAQFEGGRHIGLAGCLLRQWGIEDYRPSPDVLVTDEPLPPPAAPAVVRRADGSVIAYFPPAAALPASPGMVSRAFNRWRVGGLEPHGPYRYCVVDPRTGDLRQSEQVVADGRGTWGPEPGFQTALPSMEDWVVLLTGGE